MPQQNLAVCEIFTYQDSTEELEIEVDSLPDEDFGDLFRVWDGSKFIGSFYELTKNSWYAQSFNSPTTIQCKTPEEAQLKVVESYLGG